MVKKFSINDLVLATNNILASNAQKKIAFSKEIYKKSIEEKSQIDGLAHLELKKITIENKILSKKKKDYLVDSILDLTINLKNDTKSSIVNELNSLFKKKIKKNTLKIIVDQQLKTKNLENKINLLDANISNLENHNKNIEVDLETFSKDYELIESDNHILNDKLKRISQKNHILEIENLEFKNNLDIRNKTSQLLKKDNLTLNNKLEKTNKDKSLLTNDLNSLYEKLDNTINEKNSLQLINKEMKSILINSNKNNKLLLNNSKYLHSNLYKILKNKKLLEAFNKDLQTNLTKLEKNKNLLNEINDKIKSDLDDTKLKLNISIENNKILEIQNKEFLDKINQINNSPSKEINDKVKFYQDENVRLSSELALTQDRYDILKTNITKSEAEKDKISRQIQELNNSLHNSLNSKNIVKTPFLNEVTNLTEDNPKKIKKV